MTRSILVRHGEAAAGWGADRDPGLSDRTVGRQAAEMAAAVGPTGPLPIVVSPMRRTRETAAPLEALWGVDGDVDAGVGEITSPIDDLEERTVWLRQFMAGTWDTASAGALRRGASGCIDTLAAIDGDTVVVTHFIAINAAVGAATGDARVVSFMPGNCSRDGPRRGRTDACRLVELGGEAISVINT